MNSFNNQRNKLKDLYTYLDQSGDFLVQTDKNGYIIDLNNNLVSWLGTSTSKVIGKPFYFLVDYQDQNNLKILLEETVFLKNPLVNIDLRLINSKGEKYKVSFNIETHFENNNFLGFFMVGTRSNPVSPILKYKEIIENINGGLIDINLAGEILDINLEFSNISGYHSYEIIKKPFNILFNTTFNTHLKNLISTNLHFSQKTIESKLLKKNGEQIDCLISISNIFDSTENIIGITLMVLDISSTKTKEKLLISTQRDLNFYAKTLEKINILFSSDIFSFSDKLEKGLIELLYYFKFSSALILEEKKDYLEIIKRIHLNNVNIRQGSGLEKLDKEDSIGFISILKDEIIEIPDLDNSPYHDFGVLKKNQMQSILAIPLKISHDVKGALVIYKKSPSGSFEKTQLEILNQISYSISNLIRDEYLNKKIRKKEFCHSRLNKIVADDSLNYAEKIMACLNLFRSQFSFDYGAFHEVVEDYYYRKFWVGDFFPNVTSDTRIPYQNSIIKMAFDEDDVLIVEDLNAIHNKCITVKYSLKAGIKTGVVVSVHKQNLCIAAITFGKKESIQTPYSEDDIELFKLLGQIINFIYSEEINKNLILSEQKRQFEKNEELVQERKYLESINKFVTGLLGKEDLYSIGWEITENIISEFGFTDCVVYILNEEKETLEQIAAYGAKKAIGKEIQNPISIPIGQGIVGNVAKSKKGEIIKDTRIDPRYIKDEFVRFSEICVPIIHDNKVLGVIDSEHIQINFFTEKHFEILTTIANLTANKLANVQANLKQRDAEKALIDKDLMLISIIENALDAIITIDQNGFITEWNSQSENTFGWTAGEAIGKKLTENIIPKQHVDGYTNKLAQATFTGNSSFLNRRIELTALHKNGKEFPVELSIVPITSNDKKYFTAFLRDITKQKEAIQEIKNALEKEIELNELKSKFISITSHEFRTPLTTIKQNIDLINYKLENEITTITTDYSKYINRINSEIGRLTKLMNDTLTLGKIEAGKIQIQKETSNLPELIDNIIQKIITGRADNRNINFKTFGNIQNASIDRQLMDQALSNLLSNALKYSEGRPDPQITLNFEKDSHVEIRIQDYGIGIPIKDQKDLFNPFFRASNVNNIQGSGLGLSIVKEMILLHGGTIEFESEVNKGSTFKIKLPYN